MNLEIVSCEKPPDREGVTQLLHEYYSAMIGGVAKLGVTIDPREGEKATQEFWQQVELFLPPVGCLLLAKNEEGLVGIGMLKKIRPDAGEMKRLYVRPEMRGTGLGRKLVEKRIEVAREMGLKKLYVDTLKSTAAMQGLYKSLGFLEIGPYPESASYNQIPQHVDAMLFFEKEI